jgi:hypothetical protein
MAKEHGGMKRRIKSYRRDDPDSLPVTKARQSFLDGMAKHTNVVEMLLGEPMRLWKSLSPAAKRIARRPEGGGILDAPSREERLDESVTAHPDLAAFVAPDNELDPLRDAIVTMASEFGLTLHKSPVRWAVATMVETLSYPPKLVNGQKPRWRHPFSIHEEYPALTDPSWISASTELPEEELCSIVIEIDPKQPDEDLNKFKRRFRQTCKDRLEQYLKQLSLQGWSSKRMPAMLGWIDKLAQWQAGKSASKIDPKVKTPAARSAVSRGIRCAARFIGITPRQSKHHPKRQRTLTPH